MAQQKLIHDNKPLVGVIADVQQVDLHACHIVGDKYVRALPLAADVVPLLIPALSELIDPSSYLDQLDGLFLTGAYSMVDPKHYGQEKIEKPYNYDEKRDVLSFALIQGAIERNMPLFGSCRGFQDVNVAMGGTLHQSVYEVEGLDDHREDKKADLNQQYADVHSVEISSGGMLATILNEKRLQVNSLHSQGVDQLGSGLTAEAFAPDGLVEAFSVDALDFGLLVQWHPEWQVQENPKQQQLYAAFGKACLVYAIKQGKALQ